MNAAGIAATLKIVEKPADSNFMVIAVPSVVSIPPEVPSGTLTAVEAPKVNALLANQAAIFEIGAAAATSGNRARGAHDAGSNFWEMRQTQAAQSYARELGPLFAAQANILTALHDALVAAASP